MKFCCLLLVVSSVTGTANELLEMYNEYSNKYKEHACAVFEVKPYLGKWSSPQLRMSKDFIYEEKCAWFDCKYIVCIPKHYEGTYVERRGDGGFDMWFYNGNNFQRKNARIIVRPKRN
ncbi:hypothetical protein DSO57_1013402 [Entomophthora muscae]|uniref:Uncharacterized protein n=1 Tax=Entomophthora muscae TaxID=34485 RepID=A0ACC2RWT8_9FUNG|nr:hypothetical protein DSO57_1013402 [Entomophthora muscae]